MIESKYLNKIVAVLLILSLLSCALIVYAAAKNPNTKTMAYEDKLFGQEIVTIEIKINEEDWESLLSNPNDKEYIAADLTINGETYTMVGVRTKGNSSLSQVAQMKDSDRYSLNIKLNEYKKGQTFYGLDTFCLNNMIGDNTYMKDYLSYDLMNFIGVPTPLINYAQVKVNDEDYGFCLILERYDKAFLDRVFDTSGGQLYNVKTDMGQKNDNFNENTQPNMGGIQNNRRPQEEGNLRNNIPENNFIPDGLEESTKEDSTNPFFKDRGQVTEGNNNHEPQSSLRTPEGEAEEKPQAFENPFSHNMKLPFEETENSIPKENDSSLPSKERNNQNRSNQEEIDFLESPRGNMDNIGFPGGRNSSNGGSLVYTDDQISSYSNIFDNAKFKKNSDQDKAKVITAIKNLNEGNDLEKYFDVDEILRYLAAHTVVVNLDSYSSTMAQNYYIYELEGKISILPWDYNLAFGGFQGGEADSMINFPIDTPVSGVTMEDRPLISKLLEVPEYLEKYHEYLNEIVEGYFNSGLFAETISVLDKKINEYVKNDTTAFVSYEKYTASLPILTKLGLLRAQSIEGQLNGTIPSTTTGQAAQSSTLIKSEGISLSDLGTFGGVMTNRPETTAKTDFRERFNSFSIPDFETGNSPLSNDLNDSNINERQNRAQTQDNKDIVSVLLRTDTRFILLLLISLISVTYLLSKTEKRY